MAWEAGHRWRARSKLKPVPPGGFSQEELRMEVLTVTRDEDLKIVREENAACKSGSTNRHVLKWEAASAIQGTGWRRQSIVVRVRKS